MFDNYSSLYISSFQHFNILKKQLFVTKERKTFYTYFISKNVLSIRMDVYHLYVIVLRVQIKVPEIIKLE